MRRTFLLAAAAIIACAGCGGPSAEQRRAAERSWSRQAERICEESATVVASRGEPSTVDDLERYTRDVSGDLRGASREISRLKVPEGAEARSEAVIGRLRTADAPLRALTDAGANGDRGAEVEAAKALRSHFAKLERPLQAGGLRSCFDSRQGDAIADHVLAPIWTQEFTELERESLRGLEGLGDTRGLALGQYPAVLRKAAKANDRNARAVSHLEPPSVVDDGHYLKLLARLSASARRLADEIEVRDPARLRRALRALGSATTASEAERDRLLRASNATATPPEDDGEGGDGDVQS
jgi:pyruvate/2-oxoglutarate dehydrogenase complex dihydrolipoamide acyltransferase (E2) component